MVGITQTPEVPNRTESRANSLSFLDLGCHSTPVLRYQSSTFLGPEIYIYIYTYTYIYIYIHTYRHRYRYISPKEGRERGVREKERKQGGKD